MIPMTADQIEVLVKARDILGEKAIQDGAPYAGLCEAVQNSLLMVLKHTHVEIAGPVVNPPNPHLGQAGVPVLQGDSPGSPDHHAELPKPQGFVNLGYTDGIVRNT